MSEHKDIQYLLNYLAERDQVISHALLQKLGEEEVADYHRKYRAAQEEIDEVGDQIYRDPLTNLGNRIYFELKLNEAANTAKEKQLLVAVIVIDLNRFKNVNDSWGHNAGNFLLRVLALRLGDVRRSRDVQLNGERSSRELDTLARLGGDEFGAIILVPGKEEAIEFANRVAHVITQPVSTEHFVTEVGASIGIALGPQAGESLEDFEHRADAAMYEAKKNKLPWCLAP